MEIPLSVVGYFIGFLAVTALGIRSFIRYNSLKTPLNYYFGLTGLTFGLGMFFYSVPFMVTTAEIWLKLAFATGDALIFTGLIIQAQILWYVQLHKLISNRLAVLIPTVLVAAISWILNTYHSFKGTVTIENGEVLYSLPPLGLYLWAMLYLLLIALGVYFFRHSAQAANTGGRIRSISLGFLYVVSGLGGVFNNLFFGGQTSFTSAIAYLTVFAVFLVSLVTVNLKLGNRPTEPPKSSSSAP